MELGLVAVWIAAFLLLGLLALPLAAWLFPDLDYGPLAVPLGLAVVGVVGHLVGQVAFPVPALAAGVAAIAGLSTIAARTADVDWRAFAEAGAVFVAAFLLIVSIRAFDPAAAPLPLAVGEKFLDFGMLTTLERADALPPVDVWFAGEPVRYYYGGHLLTTLLGTLTGTEPRFAYNLALAGFYAALVTTAWGVAGSVAAPTVVPRRLAAGLGAFFVGLAANLATAIKTVAWLLPDPFAEWVVAAGGLPSDAASWSPGEFYYFDASRVVPTDPSVPESGMAATEFPLFAWLNGDLHAHMMSQPFTLLAAAVLLAYWRLPATARRRRALLLFGVLPPIAGFVGFTNLWSFPTVGGLTALAVALAPAEPLSLLPQGYADRLDRGGAVAAELRRVGLAVGIAVAVLLLGALWTLPFWLGAVLAGPGRTIALWDARTPLGNLIVVHGAFLAVFAVALARRTGAVVGQPLRVLGAFGALLVATTVLGFPALGLVAPLAIAAWWLCRRRKGDFALALVVAGAGLVLIVELVTIDGERFNTIFKPYSHVWLFWAVAAGVLLARLIDGWPADGLDVSRPRLRGTGRVLAVALVLSTSLYGAFALPAHVGDASPGAQAEGPTLDATAYLETEYPAEAPAIRWLDDREGQPTIVTAAPGGYWWRPDQGDGASAPASLTGLPTVLGWFHEQQYRGEEPYQQRLQHVETIYTSDDQQYQRDLLEYYGVEYVYVGPAERVSYGEITVGNVSGVGVAAEFEDVTIYRFRPPSSG